MILCRGCSCMEETWLQGRWDLFRNIVHDVVDNPFFEWTILLLIFASRLIKDNIINGIAPVI